MLWLSPLRGRGGAVSNPGWYPDPGGAEGQSRFWDGQQWTDDMPQWGQTESSRPGVPSANTFPTQPADMTGAGESPPLGPGQRYCRGCGQIVVQSAAFCPACGTAAGGPFGQGLPRAPAPKDRTTAILLAVFLGPWSWLYTYQRDSTKFWIGMGVGVLGAILTFFIVGFFVILGIHIWAIVDVVGKSDDYYVRYPIGHER